MSNRRRMPKSAKRGVMMNQPQMPPNQEDVMKGLQAFAELGKRVKANGMPTAMPSDAGIRAPEPIPMIEKPADQILLGHAIQWNWYLPQRYWVRATFWKDNAKWMIEFGCKDTTQTAGIS